MFRAIAEGFDGEPTPQPKILTQKLRLFCERVFRAKDVAAGPSVPPQAYADGGSRSRVPSNGEGPETSNRHSACANVGTQALAFRVDAFSLREPAPTSLENARWPPKAIGASMEPAAVPCQFHLLGRKRAEAGPQDFVALSGSVVARGIAPRRDRTGTKAAAIAALHLHVGYHSTTIRTGVAGAEEIGTEFDIQERGK
jgi:hypothetical protein